MLSENGCLMPWLHQVYHLHQLNQRTPMPLRASVRKMSSLRSCMTLPSREEGER
jgi:hypothetical protein